MTGLPYDAIIFEARSVSHAGAWAVNLTFSGPLPVEWTGVLPSAIRAFKRHQQPVLHEEVFTNDVDAAALVTLFGPYPDRGSAELARLDIERLAVGAIRISKAAADGSLETKLDAIGHHEAAKFTRQMRKLISLKEPKH